MTFDILIKGQMKKSLWWPSDGWPRRRPVHWKCLFSYFQEFNTHLIEINLNFLTFDPLITGQRGHHEHFSMVDIDQHTGMVSFVIEGCLKYDL